MKKKLLFFAFTLMANYAEGAILRCNNNPVTGTYITAQAAHDAANMGDTIHLEPSTTSYGALIITKHIVLISTGDFLMQNPGYQVGLVSGSCSSVTVATGGSSSVISAKIIGVLTLQVNDVIIVNSHCGGITLSTNTILNNITIRKCYINGTISFPLGTVANIIISNNYLGSGSLTMNSTSSGVISNNIFGFACTLYNSLVSNNIFLYNIGLGFNNCIVSNNISPSSSALPTLNGNMNSVDMSTVFVNWGSNGNGFSGDNYQLKPTYSNQDLGIYGGSDPYKPATTPAVPSIYNLTVPMNTAGGNLNVTVSTRSNN